MFNPTFPIDLFKKVKYKKGEIIKNEGDVCSSIGIIISGSISIVNITFENKEFLINSLTEGEMFGENLIFLENNLYPGTILCNQNTLIIYISKNNFIKLIQEDLGFATYYFSYISNSFFDLQSRVKILSQTSIKDKFLFYLKNQMLLTNKNFVIIKSQSNLAKYLNIPRPSLSRTISELIKEGIIAKNKKIYKIKKAW